MARLDEEQFRELLAFRTALRRFLRWSDEQAAAAGLTGQQHQLLLAIRGHEGHGADDRRRRRAPAASPPQRGRARRSRRAGGARAPHRRPRRRASRSPVVDGAGARPPRPPHGRPPGGARPAGADRSSPGPRARSRRAFPRTGAQRVNREGSAAYCALVFTTDVERDRPRHAEPAARDPDQPRPSTSGTRTSAAPRAPTSA